MLHEVSLGDIKSIASESEAAGYKALFAAVIRVAALDARSDRDAAAWIGSERCSHMLFLIAPDGVDPDMLQERLIAQLPAGSRSIAQRVYHERMI